jgi:RPA family protein
MEDKKRQIAYKVKISEILCGEYVKEEGWVPNYVLFEGIKISRANVMGILIAKKEEGGTVEALIDDKTGKISIRSFDNADLFKKFSVGDFILVIGRPREYNNEKYVVPEIIKKIKRSWFELRILELGCTEMKGVGGSVNRSLNEGEKNKEKQIVDEIIQSKINSEDVLELIKKWDTGKGADYERLVEKIGDEKIIRTLLEEGDVFEVAPGKLKSL